MVKAIFSNFFSGKVDVFPPFKNEIEMNTVAKKYGAATLSKYAARAYKCKPSYGKIIPGAVNAIITYSRMLLELADERTHGYAVLGITPEGDYLGEYPEESGLVTLCVASRNPSGAFSFRATALLPTSSAKSGATYELDDDKEHGEALIFTILPAFMKDSEFRETFLKFHGMYSEWERTKNVEDRHEMIKCMALLCDNMYRRTTYPKECELIEAGGGLPVQAMYNAPTQTLLDEDFTSGRYTVEKNLAKTPFRFFGARTRAARKSRTSETKLFLRKKWKMSELERKFQRNPERSLSEKEAHMLEDTKARLGDWYIVPQQLIKAAMAAKETYGKTIQFSNFYFYGEAGGGKSSAAMALAVALGIPYTHLTFSANTEIMDVLQSISPETVDEEGETIKMQEILKKYPDSMSIAMDPAKAYLDVTGITKADALPEEVHAAIYQDIAEQMDRKGQRFRYVDSPLAQAFRYGYLCELQEPNIVTNPGVLVGINALLDRTATMVCANGEIVRRHPDFIAVDTTNRSYAACRDVNASHLSRFHMALRFDKPGNEELMERIRANTGFSDESVLLKMLDVMNSMCDVLRSSGEENYSCGTREICNWVTWYQILGDPVDSAMDTIVPLATQNEELIDQLKTCVLTEFSA